MFSHLLDRFHLACSTVEESEVLVVASSHYRVMEPASIAGFPTVLVQRPGCLGSEVDLGTCDPTLLVDGLQALAMKLQQSSSVLCPSPLKQAMSFQLQIRVYGIYQVTSILGMGGFGNVSSTFHVLTGSKLYANLEQLRRLCRGELSLKKVFMLGLQMLDRIEFAHSRGVVLRDVKPENFAMGIGEKSHIVYLFDFGLAKVYVDPSTGAHITFREGRVPVGTARYMSYMHILDEVQQGRRDDLEILGNVLLYLLHGHLPWQGIYPPSVEAKLLRIGEMKAGSAFRDLLARSSTEFTTYFDHCRGLKSEEKPSYALLRQLFSQITDREGGMGDTRFDQADESSRKGTLVPDEYISDVRFTGGDLTTLQGIRLASFNAV
ncbi:kinase-like domain-containing protein [Suillus paluster]|uniref:kinase-like domain-containing protein n=1 Tax=Suillus paluster TaxID=48578 RepID=UPI001B866EF9|nr:kinase-like domain-containing protein [Suillus paluster]KAG1741524.1 kinase-like domain-containing protein [Suillus paluster]